MDPRFKLNSFKKSPMDMKAKSVIEKYYDNSNASDMNQPQFTTETFNRNEEDDYLYSSV